MFLRIPVAAISLLACLACLPSRPANVPKDAPWVGTREEGCFLRIGDREFKGWKMEGWDKNGTLIIEGLWELDGIARARINTDEITRFDGHTLYMTDGAVIAKQTESQ
jgi:hypothetical protein